MNEIYENIFLHIIWKLKFNAKTINKKIVENSSTTYFKISEIGKNFNNYSFKSQ